MSKPIVVACSRTPPSVAVRHRRETDDVKSVEIVEIEPAQGRWHNSLSGDDLRGKAAMRPGSERPVLCAFRPLWRSPAIVSFLNP